MREVAAREDDFSDGVGGLLVLQWIGGILASCEGELIVSVNMHARISSGLTVENHSFYSYSPIQIQ